MNNLLYNPERAGVALESFGADAYLATNSGNVQYFTHFRKGGGAISILSGANIGSPMLIVKSSGMDYILEDPCDPLQIRVCGNFYRFVADNVDLNERENLIRQLHESASIDKNEWDLAAEELDRVGLKNGTLVVDATPDTLVPLSKRLPDIKIKSAPDLFRRLRMVKTPEEIARLAEGARITEQAIYASVTSASLGTTQSQLARAFSLSAIAAGCFIRQDNASIGRGSALGNCNQPRDIVEDGSIIRYDLGVFCKGYATDIARTFAFRSASARVRDYMGSMVAGQNAALDHIHPGTTANEVFYSAVDAVRKAGVPHFNRTHIGHGIGIAGGEYDPPLLAASDNTILEPGMVLCVETPYVELGFGCVHVEDMVVVTEKGYEFLTHTERNLVIVP